MILARPTSAKFETLDLSRNHAHLDHIAGGAVDATAPLRTKLKRCVQALRTESLREETLQRLETVFRQEFPAATCTRYLLGSLFLGIAIDDADWESEKLPTACEMAQSIQDAVRRKPGSDAWRDRALGLYEEAMFYIPDKGTPAAHLIGGFGTAYYYCGEYSLLFPQVVEDNSDVTSPDVQRSFPKTFQDSMRRLSHDMSKLTTDSFNIRAYQGAQKTKPRMKKVDPHVPQVPDEYLLAHQGTQTVVQQKPIREPVYGAMGCLALHAYLRTGKTVFDDFLSRFLGHWEKEWFPMLIDRWKGESDPHAYRRALLNWRKDQMESLMNGL